MSKSLYCANFYISFSLFCRKSFRRWMRRFWAKKCRRDHLRSLWRSVVLATVHRWQRGAATEGRWVILTKCGVTKLVTVRRVYDGPSCRFVIKFREVIPVSRFQELKCFGMKTLDGPLYLWRSVILAIEGNEESSRINCISMGRRSPWRSVVTMTVCCDHHGPSRGPSTKPHFDRFPANRVLVWLGFYFL